VTTWSSAGNGGVGSRPGRRRSRALSRGGADGHGGRRRAARTASLSMWLLAVTQVSGTALSLIGAGGPSNGADDSFTVQRSQSRSYVLATLRALHLDSDLPQQTHRHLSGWTGRAVDG
jgi:hypothetical protein